MMNILQRFLVTLFALTSTLVVGSVSITYAATTLDANQYVIFYHSDLLGSPAVVTDHNGNTLWHEHSDPYGRARARVTETRKVLDHDRVGSRKGYTGHLNDEGSNLVYMKARFYDPQIGRFYSNDSVGFISTNTTSFNRYAYANNSPYRFVDPDGRYGSDWTAETFGKYNDDDDDYAIESGVEGAAWSSYANSHNHNDIDSNNNPIRTFAPDGIDVEANMIEMRKVRGSLVGLAVFFKLVRNEGRWDYKTLSQGLETLGNYNYGATGTALGVTPEVLLNMAGISQVDGNVSDPDSSGTPGGYLSPTDCTKTCGDQPWDHFNIHQGIRRAQLYFNR